ncbi:RNA polymerase sigma factor [Nonomuraea sp. NPDC046570]|uniref:RNA polymerase sigma factor n=1 Tax=Nonomuraea sp. NPDC046570 TaxID=3155255 RepID=UPI0034061156
MTASPSTMPASDSALVGRSLTEPEAFAALFDRYSGMLYRYIVKRLGPEPAEDLVGETFLIAFARRKSYDLSCPDARPWLFGIATKLLSRHHRRESARYRALRRAPRDSAAESPADAVAAGVTASAARPLLAQALAALPARDRDVLLLIAWGDLSYEETADALRIPVGTVRSRLNRARRKVRAALGETNPMHEEE